MQIGVHLDLPRDARYVPVMRNVAHCLLSDLGAPRASISDIQLALSEACANVVRHASGRTYRVSLTVQDSGCDIEVADAGPGFDARRLPGQDQALEAESGRGLQLMEALVDDLFVVRQDGDNVVRLHKEWPALDLSIEAREAAAARHRHEQHS